MVLVHKGLRIRLSFLACRLPSSGCEQSYGRGAYCGNKVFFSIFFITEPYPTTQVNDAGLDQRKDELLVISVLHHFVILLR